MTSAWSATQKLLAHSWQLEQDTRLLDGCLFSRPKSKHSNIFKHIQACSNQTYSNIFKLNIFTTNWDCGERKALFTPRSTFPNSWPHMALDMLKWPHPLYLDLTFYGSAVLAEHFTAVNFIKELTARADMHPVTSLFHFMAASWSSLLGYPPVRWQRLHGSLHFVWKIPKPSILQCCYWVGGSVSQIFRSFLV